MPPNPAAPASGRSPRSRAASISSSTSSESLKPSAPKNFSPLSAKGLWEAEMTAAPSRPSRPSRTGAAGVGSTPASRASPPAAATPAASALSSIGPDSRVSRTTSRRGRTAPDAERAWSTTARPRASASSAVSSSPATPRTPSVPNRRRGMAGTLTLGELRPLAGLLQAGLLALLHPGVAGEEAAALELAAEVRVGLEQGPGDAVAQGAGLGGLAAAVDAGDDVHPGLVAHGLERLADRPLQRGPREVVVERAVAPLALGAGQREVAVAGLEVDAGHGALALAHDVAPRGVARAGGEVDRGLGDPLLLLGLLGVRGDGLVVLIALLGVLGG